MKKITMVLAGLVATLALAAPKPPTAEDPLIAITPVTRNMDQVGGDAAINTSGSGTWRASVSDNWILLKGTSGAAGFPVPYVVSARGSAAARCCAETGRNVPKKASVQHAAAIAG